MKNVTIDFKPDDFGPETEFEEKGTIADFPKAQKISSGEEMTVPCHIIAPCAKEDMITVEVAGRIKAKIITEGANLAILPDAQSYLLQQGICYVPDFIANAGGVIGAFAESIDESPDVAFSMVKKKIENNVKTILEISKKENISPREAGLKMAKERVIVAMKAKGIWERQEEPFC